MELPEVAALAQQAQPEMLTRDAVEALRSKANDTTVPLVWASGYADALDDVLALFAPECAGVEHDPDKKCAKCAPQR